MDDLLITEAMFDLTLATDLSTEACWLIRNLFIFRLFDGWVIAPLKMPWRPQVHSTMNGAPHRNSMDWATGRDLAAGPGRQTRGRTWRISDR